MRSDSLGTPMAQSLFSYPFCHFGCCITGRNSRAIRHALLKVTMWPGPVYRYDKSVVTGEVGMSNQVCRSMRVLADGPQTRSADRSYPPFSHDSKKLVDKVVLLHNKLCLTKLIYNIGASPVTDISINISLSS
jgi:hypothetical protein